MRDPLNQDRHRAWRWQNANQSETRVLRLRVAIGLWLSVVAVLVASTLISAIAIGGNTDRLLRLEPMEQPIPAPLIDAVTISDRTISAEQLRGRTLVVNFWATWCKPCRTEMPDLETLHQSLGTEAYLVLGIAMGDDASTYKAFADSTGYRITFPIILDVDERVTKQWPVVVVPTTFVVDPSGFIRYRATGIRHWAAPEMIEKIHMLRKEAE